PLARGSREAAAASEAETAPELAVAPGDLGAPVARADPRDGARRGALDAEHRPPRHARSGTRTSSFARRTQRGARVPRRRGHLRGALSQPHDPEPGPDCDPDPDPDPDPDAGPDPGPGPDPDRGPDPDPDRARLHGHARSPCGGGRASRLRRRACGG